MARLGSGLAALGSVQPSLTLCREHICRRRPTRVGGVLVQTRLKRFQVFEEGEHRKTHTQRGLLPLFSRYAKSLWKEGRIKRVAHDAVSSGLMNPSLSQNGW